MSEIEAAVYEGLRGHYGHIAEFWQFVEVQGLVLNNDADVQRALFVFLVGDEW